MNFQGVNVRCGEQASFRGVTKMWHVHPLCPRLPRQPRLLQDPPPRPRLPWRRGRGARGGVPGPEKLVPEQPGSVQVARGSEQGLAR